MRYRLVYLILSLTVIVPGILTLVTSGLRPAIDFTGGTLLELKLAKAESQVETEQLKKDIESQQLEVGSVQSSGVQNFIIRLKPIDNEQKVKLLESLKQQYQEVTELRFETVGPTLGRELLQKTFIASLVAIIGILLYVAWAFKNIQYGVSAVIALIHDLLVVISVFALLGKWFGVEVDSLFVTAVLTTMSFSVHDTIVVFDRIRESKKKTVHQDFGHLVNQALTDTMGRSLNNSLTIIFMLLALVLMGGDSIRWFAVALLVGTITGTYSSPFVATPILYTWSLAKRKRTS